MSIRAYQQTAQRVETPREIEYRAFTLATQGLIQARDAPTPAARLRASGEALDKNRRMWAMLAVECADRASPLPEALRAQIISLSMFVERHTRAVIRDNAEIDVLIDINTSMMEGLSPAAGAAR